MLYWEACGLSDDPYLLPSPKVLRAGVWLREDQRFLPVEPYLKKVSAWYYADDKSFLAAVPAERYPGNNSSLANVSIEVYDTNTAELLTDTPYPPEGYEGPEAIDFDNIKGSVFLRFVNNELSYPDKPRKTDWHNVINEKK